MAYALQDERFSLSDVVGRETWRQDATRGATRSESCQSCCSSCGQHFVGDRAYDAHRRFGECIDAIDSPKFELRTARGVCGLSRPQVIGPIAIWGLAGSMDRIPHLVARKG